MPGEATGRRRAVALALILLVDAGFVLWGAAAAVALEHLPGPGGAPILAAGYQGFTGGSWPALAHGSARTAAYIVLLFRLYGAYNVAFGLTASAIAIFAFRRGETWAWWALLLGNTLALGAAMTYDRMARAIGPFEISEYVGLAAVYAALAMTLPLRRARPTAAGEVRRPAPRT